MYVCSCMYSINYMCVYIHVVCVKASDLIGATNIPVPPFVLYTVSPDSILRGGCTRLYDCTKLIECTEAISY